MIFWHAPNTLNEIFIRHKQLFQKFAQLLLIYFWKTQHVQFNSFAIACHRLGATYLSIDAAKTSLSKGESLRETFLTLKHQGIDLVIMRTPNKYEFSPFKEDDFPLAIINAGDGTHQHPTQALLDLFTMIASGHTLEGKTILIAGDCEHSRVARSLIDLLPLYGAKILLAGPSSWTKKIASQNQVETEEDMDAAIKKADLIYLLRIQNERHDQKSDEEFSKSYHKNYGVNLARIKRLNKLIPIYHPGPFNEGVEISLDIVNSPYYFGYKQVEHSTYMRMAIIEKILKRTGSKYV